jgi:hypothetical protein
MKRRKGIRDCEEAYIFSFLQNKPSGISVSKLDKPSTKPSGIFLIVSGFHCKIRHLPNFRPEIPNFSATSASPSQFPTTSASESMAPPPRRFHPYLRAPWNPPRLKSPPAQGLPQPQLQPPAWPPAQHPPPARPQQPTPPPPVRHPPPTRHQPPAQPPPPPHGSSTPAPGSSTL